MVSSFNMILTSDDVKAMERIETFLEKDNARYISLISRFPNLRLPDFVLNIDNIIQKTKDKEVVLNVIDYLSNRSEKGDGREELGSHGRCLESIITNGRGSPHGITLEFLDFINNYEADHSDLLEEFNLACRTIVVSDPLENYLAIRKGKGKEIERIKEGIRGYGFSYTWEFYRGLLVASKEDVLDEYLIQIGEVLNNSYDLRNNELDKSLAGVLV